MSLPPLLKYVYNHGSEEVIRKGKKIYLTKGVELTTSDTSAKKIEFKVNNDVFNYHYRVSIQNYDNLDRINVRCQCPYNMGVLCRHEVAALMELSDMSQAGYFSDENIVYDQSHTAIRMKHIDLNTLRTLCSNAQLRQANDWAKKNKVKIKSSENDTVLGFIRDETEVYNLKIIKSEAQIYETSCECKESKHPLCEHKVALFLQLLNTYGSLYFDTIKDPNKLKNKLLSRYGYTLDTPNWEEKFEFHDQDGKVFLKVLDTSLQVVNTTLNTAPPVSTVAHAAVKKKKEQPIIKKNKNFGIGISFTDDVPYYPYFSINIVSGILNDERTKFKDQLDYVNLLTKAVEYTFSDEKDKKLVLLAQKLSDQSIANYIKKNSAFADFIDGNDLQSIAKKLDPLEFKKLVQEYVQPKLVPFFQHIAENKYVTFNIPYKKKLLLQNTTPVQVVPELVKSKITAKIEQKSVQIDYKFFTSDKELTFEPEMLQRPLYTNEDNIYILHNVIVNEELLNELPKNVSFTDWPKFSYEFFVPLQGKIDTEIDSALIQNLDDEPVRFGVEFKDNDQTLVIKPYFIYNNQRCAWNNNEFINTFDEEAGVLRIRRNKVEENQFIEGIRSLHHNYVSNQIPYFSIRQKDVLKKSWFFKLFDYLLQKETQIDGLENLTNYKISTLKPQTQIQISSGTDWFDTKMEVKFGDEVVNIQKIRRALLKGESYVKLSSGKLALLPEEWLEKYAMIVKMGEDQGDKVRLSKINFGLLENVKDEIDNYDILAELEEKKRNLLEYNYDDVHRSIMIPNMKDAELRPYQKEGFYWLAYLSKIQWGGILADDMGLGKTLQTLTLIQYYLRENPNANILIVTPTSLLHNWNNEINKFAPDIKFQIHHGLQREKNVSQLYEQNQVIMTSYGTLRSDAPKMKSIEFDYVILDESQMIKNPMAQITKSVNTLTSKNRLCLSGTPLQNNTFDIYAQMNFLNPGMLGSTEFFKNEIANPIDKMQDEEVKRHLHKMLYPFILRRTKEDVAPDLPAKTESVLWVEMEDNQRKLYNEYRDFYRSQILNEIGNQGLGKTKFTILQGLTKLRQICDSPAILPDAVNYTDQAGKISTLVDQIDQIKTNHKSLIFSQFIGMLSLIKTELEKANIPYAYFDGSTNSTDRHKMIEKFQGDPNCRVFLISLKAGGVGLNLTSADYVYLVDPWWNPAIEQQAIDRTHRIGQTKNIFAYRMICKDTIEEKILELQDKKKSLVKDLIGDDKGFVKKLTEDDILYLFS